MLAAVRGEPREMEVRVREYYRMRSSLMRIVSTGRWIGAMKTRHMLCRRERTS